MTLLKAIARNGLKLSLALLFSSSCWAMKAASETACEAELVTRSLTTKQFFQALEQTIRATAGRGLEWALTRPTIENIISGQHLSDIIDPWQQKETAKALKDEHRHPHPIEWTRPGGDHELLIENGLSLFRGGIFFDGYFFKSGLTERNRTQALTRTQPWLEYDRINKNYVTHAEGGNAALTERWFETVEGDQVTLYRGLTEEQELGWMTLIRELENGRGISADAILKQFNIWKEVVATDDPQRAEALENAQGKRLKDLATKIDAAGATERHGFALALSSFVREAAVSLGRDAIFTSPSLETGKKWGMKGLVAFTLPKALFKEMSDGGEVFVGIENELEIALISERAQSLFHRSFFQPIENFRWKSPRAD
jgi:hypothetical protein